MRRTRVAAGALAGSLWLTALAPAATAAEPRAEISPHRARPGQTVTITVTCPKHDEKVGHLTAYSQAFEKGETELKRVRGGSGGHGDATYRGTARITSAHHRTGDTGRYGSDVDGPGAYESEDGAGEHGSGDDGSRPYGSSGGAGSEGLAADPDGAVTDGAVTDGAAYEVGHPADASATGPDDASGGFDSGPGHGDEHGTPPSGAARDGSSHHERRYAVNGSCPGGKDFSGSVVVATKPRGGAHAGQGGSRSAPGTATVAAGGAVLSAALGLGVYALRRRRSQV